MNRPEEPDLPTLANYARLLVRGPMHLLPARGPERSPAPEPRRAALIGLIVTLLLVIGGLFLVHVLDRAGKLQDCVMSGRTDCAPISAAKSDR